MPTPRPPHSRLVPLGLAAGLVIGNLFLHLPISDMCDWALARWGFPVYNRVAVIGIPGLSLVLLAALVRRRMARWRALRTWCVALSLLIMSMAMQRWMLVSNIELIHFPQYGLIAALLLLGGVTAEPAWLLATAAGILDETYQQFVVYAGRRDTYLDFNDMILNAVGAAWVVLAFAPHGRAAPTWWRWPRPARWLLPSIAVAALVAPPQLTPFLRPSAGFTLYRVIGFTEALAWATVIWGLVALATTTDEYRIDE